MHKAPGSIPGCVGLEKKPPPCKALKNCFQSGQIVVSGQPCGLIEYKAVFNVHAYVHVCVLTLQFWVKIYSTQLFATNSLNMLFGTLLWIV